MQDILNSASNVIDEQGDENSDSVALEMHNVNGEPNDFIDENQQPDGSFEISEVIVNDNLPDSSLPKNVNSSNNSDCNGQVNLCG